MLLKIDQTSSNRYDIYAVWNERGFATHSHLVRIDRLDCPTEHDWHEAQNLITSLQGYRAVEDSDGSVLIILSTPGPLRALLRLVGIVGGCALV